MSAKAQLQAAIKASNLTWLNQGIIFLTRHGSHAYGLNTATSDEDFKGVAIPPKQYFNGFLERFEQAEFRHQVEGVDAAIYDIRKFFKLAVDCNPSIIEVLFTEPEDHLIKTWQGEVLIQNRNLFISKKAKHTFSGYAVSQLKKLLRSKERAPERLNEARAESVLKFGYDTKDAMHTIRLLKMGQEILRGEGVRVRRADRDYFLGIRNGDWKLEDIIALAEATIVDMEALYTNSTAIPNEPDRHRLDRLCQELVLETTYEVKNWGPPQSIWS